MEVMLVILGQHSDQLFDLKIGLNLYYFFVSILVEKKQIQNEIVEISFVEIFESPPETEILLRVIKLGVCFGEKNITEYLALIQYYLPMPFLASTLEHCHCCWREEEEGDSFHKHCRI